ncbi:MAG: MerC domain-containing protein [Porticoccaceae bacterium]|nr:MerC domain-containing protein [Porticoccaceae bacterium]MDG1474800.1 MerC domain-containing protein [Porticoccaceae bacterium]
MKIQQAATDRIAIGLSIACVVHCLMLPILILALPSIAALNLDNEAFHVWMVVAVIPCSIFALSLGCKEHKRYQLFFWALPGLAMLVLALVLGEERIGEAGEKIMTLAGASLVAVGHWLNFRLCRAQDDKNCGCPGDQVPGAK